jgi:hypothetical protein
MGEQIGHVGAVDTIQQQHDAHDDENDTHHPAGQFNADEHAETATYWSKIVSAPVR